MRPDDIIRLRHMPDAAQQAQAFVQDKRRDDLDDDLKLVWAMVKAIEIIGEAASCQPGNQSADARDFLEKNHDEKAKTACYEPRFRFTDSGVHPLG